MKGNNERRKRQAGIKKKIDELRANGYRGGQEAWDIFRLAEIEPYLRRKKGAASEKAKGNANQNEAFRIFEILQKQGEVFPIKTSRWESLIKEKIMPLWTLKKCPSASSFIVYQRKYRSQKNKG